PPSSSSTLSLHDALPILISFIIFICIFGKAALIVNVAYLMVLTFHLISVGGIIFFSGAVVRKNVTIVNTVITMVGRNSLANGHQDRKSTRLNSSHVSISY